MNRKILEWVVKFSYKAVKNDVFWDVTPCGSYKSNTA
jgi:hypothetical protein